MRRRGVVALFVLGWFSVGPGAVVAAAQCNDNGDCGRLQYCQKSTDDCDGVGVCSERPSACPDVWVPVCGCDGSTYGNACEAAAAGINVSYQGECLPPSCLNNDDCGAGDYCQTPTGACTGQGTCVLQPPACPLIWDPVCGCDGVTYGNECFAAQVGISVASEGECPPPPCQDNSDCSQSELCLKTAGDCAGLGLCTEKPLMCPMIWMPVCGCDERTYANACEAQAAGINVAYEGECLVSCSGHGDCSLGEYCDTAHNGCGGAGACRPRPDLCTEEYDPVCGCNELSFDNACFAAMEGITVFASGVCGPCPFDASTDCIFSDALESGGATRWSGIVGN